MAVAAPEVSVEARAVVAVDAPAVSKPHNRPSLGLKLLHLELNPQLPNSVAGVVAAALEAVRAARAFLPASTPLRSQQGVKKLQRPCVFKKIHESRSRRLIAQSGAKQ